MKLISGKRSLQPGWHWLVVAAFIYLLSLVLYGYSPIFGLPWKALGFDPDNYLRALQIRDFMQTHDWYHTGTQRLNPSQGVDAFSRLADLPYLAIAMPLSLVCAVQTSLIIASFIVPFLIYLPLLFWLLYQLGKSLVGLPWAWLVPALAICFPGLINEFVPGRIDHHNLQILLTLGALCIALRLLQSRGKVQWGLGLLLGFIVATSLAVGVEAIAQLVLILAFIGLRLLSHPSQLRWQGLAIALSLPLFVSFYLYALRPAQAWDLPQLVPLTLMHVKLASAIGAVFLAGFGVSFLRMAWLRWGLMLIALAATSYLLLVNIPALLSENAMLGMPHWYIDYIRQDVIEQQPAADKVALWEGLIATFILAGCGYLYLLKQARQKHEPLGALGLLLVLLIVSFAATYGYAYRFCRVFYIAALPGLVACIKVGLQILSEKLKPTRVRFALEVLLVLACGPLTGYWLMLGISHAPIPALFSPITQSNTACDLDMPVQFLDMQYPTVKRLLVFETIGPQLVFATKHEVVGGNIYDNADGAATAKAFFEANSPASAGQVIRQSGIDLVLFCKAAAQTDANSGIAGGSEKPRTDIFKQKLERDETPQPWLKPIPIPLGKEWKLFEVDKSQLPSE